MRSLIFILVAVLFLNFASALDSFISGTPIDSGEIISGQYTSVTSESDQNFNTGFELTAQPGCEFDNGERPSKRQIDGSQEDLVALKKDFCPAGQHPFLEENPQIVPVPIPKNPEIVPQRKPEEEPEVYPNHATDWCDKIAVCCEGTIVREKYQFLRATGCTYYSNPIVDRSSPCYYGNMLCCFKMTNSGDVSGCVRYQKPMKVPASYNIFRFVNPK